MALRASINECNRIYSLFDTLTVESTSDVPSSSSTEPDGTISNHDLTESIVALVDASPIEHGTVTITTPHTTVGIYVNEYEEGFDSDLRTWLLKLAPIDDRHPIPSRRTPGVSYKHNDITSRPSQAPEWRSEIDRCLENGWNIEDPEVLKRWRAQEPINANAHLISMLVGTSVVLQVENGELVLGAWQSVIMLDADGPRTRKVNVQIIGAGN
ncbi:hypothetical protein TrVE_jg3788 [Triparma verrucosa]|nr:hypothetical protein TrVE_jg3788 [Triparma verrucosa]